MDIRGAMDKVQEALAELTDAVSTSVTYGMGGCVRAVVETPAGMDMRDDLFRLFAKYDMPIIEMTSNDVSLEDVFLRLTEDRPEEEDDSDIPGIRAAEEAAQDEEEDSASEEADEDSPYYDEPKSTKKSKEDKKDEEDSDDYKPLFGGKQ